MTEPRDPGSLSQPAGAAPDYDAPDAAARTSSNVPPDTNQPDTEPMPVNEHEDAPATGSLATMDPQGHGVVRPLPGAGSERGPAATPAGGEQVARRAPGSVGATSAPLATDTATGSERTGPGSPPASVAGNRDTPVPSPGNAHGVSVANTESLAGTSEDSAIVEGVRAPVPTPDAHKASAPGGRVPAVAERGSAPDGEVSPE